MPPLCGAVQGGPINDDMGVGLRLTVSALDNVQRGVIDHFNVGGAALADVDEIVAQICAIDQNLLGVGIATRRAGKIDILGFSRTINGTVLGRFGERP
ncbi:hypothetical protein D3C75_937500 [compost metagenome]